MYKYNRGITDSSLCRGHGEEQIAALFHKDASPRGYSNSWMSSSVTSTLRPPHAKKALRPGAEKPARFTFYFSTGEWRYEYITEGLGIYLRYLSSVVFTWLVVFYSSFTA